MTLAESSTTKRICVTPNGLDPGAFQRGVLGRLISKGTVYTVATGAQLIAAVLVLPVVTRLLDPAEFGLVAVALVVTQLLARVAMAGLPASILKSFFDDPAGPAVARRLILVALAVAVLIAGIVDLTGPLWVNLFSDLDYGPVLRVAVWTSAAIAVTMSAQSFIRAEGKAGHYAGSIAVSSIVAQALGLVLIVLTDAGALAYMTGFFAGQVVAGAYSYIVGWRTKGEVEGVAFIGMAFSYGFPLVPHSLALYALTAIDRIIIERIEGFDSVGRYTAAYAVGTLAVVIVQGINKGWTPLIFEQPAERRPEVLASTYAVLSRLTALAVAGVALAVPIGLRIAAPPNYMLADLVSVATILAPVGLIYLAYLSRVQILFYTGRTRSMALVTPLAAALNIVLNFVLIPTFGLVGAAVATLCSYALLAILASISAARLEQVPWPSQSLVWWWTVGIGATVVGVVLPIDGFVLVLRVLLALVAGVGIVILARRHRLGLEYGATALEG